MRLDVCGGMGTHLCLNSWKTGQAADKRWQLKIYDFMRGLELVAGRGLVVVLDDYVLVRPLWPFLSNHKKQKTACSIILEWEEPSRKIARLE